MAAALSLWAGAATAHPPWPETYTLRPLAQPGVLQDVQSCVGPGVAVAAVNAFVASALAARDDDATRALQLTTPKAQAVAVASAGQWACVALSPEGFPVWPLETLHGLVVPVGVPAALTSSWRRKLLTQVASDGVGRGLIVYPSGDADQVHLIAELRQAQNIKLSMRLLRAGTYDTRQFTAVLQHPGIERLVTRSIDSGQGTPFRLAIPPHRLLKPVHDDFVRVEPTETTRGFAFAGTSWIFAGGQGQVLLQTDGTVLFKAAAKGSASSTPAPRESPTHWRLADGVLQLSMGDGTRYALTMSSDRATLSGVARRVEKDAEQDEGSEWQWPAQLQRQGVPSGPGVGKWQQTQAPTMSVKSA